MRKHPQLNETKNVDNIDIFNSVFYFIILVYEQSKYEPASVNARVCYRSIIGQ